MLDPILSEPNSGSLPPVVLATTQDIILLLLNGPFIHSFTYQEFLICYHTHHTTLGPESVGQDTMNPRIGPSASWLIPHSSSHGTFTLILLNCFHIISTTGLSLSPFKKKAFLRSVLGSSLSDNLPWCSFVSPFMEFIPRGHRASLQIPAL